MSKQADPPAVPTRAEQAHADRLVREAAALRENLRRRKQQTRDRRTGVPDAKADKPPCD